MKMMQYFLLLFLMTNIVEAQRSAHLYADHEIPNYSAFVIAPALFRATWNMFPQFYYNAIPAAVNGDRSTWKSNTIFIATSAMYAVGAHAYLIRGLGIPEVWIAGAMIGDVVLQKVRYWEDEEYKNKQWKKSHPRVTKRSREISGLIIKEE